MTFFSVLCALILEQFRALSRDNPIYDVVRALAARAEEWFDTGHRRDAVLAWCMVTLPAVVVVALVHYLLSSISLGLAFLWNVVMVYLTLGFRQFSHYFTDIRDALERGDDATARQLLAEWRHLDASELPRTELIRHVIEHSLLAAHRHVFGVFFWFVVCSTVGLGPAGAIVYRMAEFASRYWGFKSRTLDAPTNPRLLALSRQAFAFVDHLPARLTATGFAIVGNFEEAVNGWRRDASLWLHPNEGIILASAAGAVGLQLGGAAAPGITPDRSKTFDAGSEPDATGAAGSTAGAPPQLAHLQSVVGLVWRSVVLWMLLLALLTLANLVG